MSLGLYACFQKLVCFFTLALDSLYITVYSYIVQYILVPTDLLFSLSDILGWDGAGCAARVERGGLFLFRLRECGTAAAAAADQPGSRMARTRA